MQKKCQGVNKMLVCVNNKPCTCNNYGSGFPQKLENLGNENGHGKVMEHEKLAKSHRIL